MIFESKPDLITVIASCVYLSEAIVFFILNERMMPNSWLLSLWKKPSRLTQSIANKTGYPVHYIQNIEAGLIFALGFGFISIGEWAATIITWVWLGVVFLLRVLAWTETDGKPRRFIVKVVGVFCVLLFTVFLIVTTILRKPDNEPWTNLQKLLPKKEVPALVTPVPSPEPQLTLETLFKTDFPNVVKTTITPDPTRFEDGRTITIISQAYEDFASKSLFVGYYIPYTDLTFRECVRIGNKKSAQSLIEAVNKRLSLSLTDDANTSIKDLTFTGRVYIYHEWPLTLQQKAKLVDYYKENGLSVQFFGIDYLKQQILNRKLLGQTPAETTVKPLTPAQTQNQQAPETVNPPTQTPKPAAVPILPYDVSGKRGEEFIALLNAQAEKRDTIRVGCVQWSEEACVAAGRFLILFSQAGWKIDSNKVFRFEPNIPIEGMNIDSKSPQYTDNLPPHLGHWNKMDYSEMTFYRTFNWMQIPVRSSGNPDMPDGTIGIYFGPEPKNVFARTTEQARKDFLTSAIILETEIQMAKQSCDKKEDCEAKSKQFKEVVTQFLKYCGCGLNSSWAKQWDEIKGNDDSDDLVKKQRVFFKKLIATLSKDQPTN